MNRSARVALCLASMLSIGCSDKPSDQPTTSVSCERGRLAKLVVDPGEWNGMSQAAATNGGGYLLFGSTAFQTTVTSVDHEGAQPKTVAIPSQLGPVIFDIAPLPGGGAILTGTAGAISKSTPWVGKVDADWRLVWERSLSSPSTSRTQFASLPDGGGVLAGIAGNFGHTTVFWDRVSATGEVLWERSLTLGGLQDSYGWWGRMLSVSPDARIRLFVVTDQGVVLIQSSMDGAVTLKLLETTLTFRVSDSVGLPDGRAALVSTRKSGAILTMVAADGSIEWEKIYGQGESAWADAIAFNAGRDELLLGGSYRGTDSGGIRTWMVAVDLDGNQTWRMVREPLETNLDGQPTGASPGKGPPITDITPQPDGSFLAAGQTTNLSYFVVGAEPCGGEQP